MINIKEYEIVSGVEKRNNKVYIVENELIESKMLV